MAAREEVLFGRDEEIARLSELLDGAERGFGAAVLIEGEGGIGKTSLTRALEARARAAGFTVLRGTCDEAAGGLPLSPVLDALGVHRRGADADADAERAEIRRLLRVGAGARQDAVPALVERLLGLAERTCTERPLLLSLDDLQWVDDASALWWQRLARYADQLPLLLVGAMRLRGASAAADALRRGRLRQRGPVVRLAALDGPALTGFAAHALGAVPGPRLTRLLLDTGGNPLHAAEFLAHVTREELLRPAGDGRPGLDLAADLQGPTLTGAVRNRIRHLPSEQREFLQTLSVLGPDCGTEEALAVVDGEARDVARLLADAVTAGLLADDGATTAFRNPLLQQALYELIPGALRPSLHARAAQRLQEAGLPLDGVLRQLAKAAAAGEVRGWAPQGSWALGWLTEHTETLVNRAPAIAVELLSPLLTADRTGAPAAAVHLALITALQRLQRHDEAAESCRRLLADSADPAAIGEASYRLTVHLQRSGRFTEVVELAEQVVARGDVPPEWVAAIWATVATSEDNLGDKEAAHRHADRAIELGTACGAWFAVGLACWFKSQFLISEDPAAALRAAGQAVDALRRDPSLRFMLAIAQGGTLLPLHQLDRCGETEDAVESLLATIGQLGGATPHATTLDLFELRFRQGRWDEATAEVEHLVEEDPAENWSLYLLQGMLAVIAAYRGDEERLRFHLDKCAGMPGGEYDVHAGQWQRLARAVAADRAGRPAEAVAALLEHFDPARVNDQDARFRWLPQLVRCALAAGDRATARRAAGICRTEAERAAVPYWRQSAAHCAALLAGDAAALHEVAAYYQHTDRPLESAQALHDAVLAHRAAGEHRKAEAAADQALAGYRRLGVVSSLSAALDGPQRGWDALTATERRIALLAARPLSNPQIAAELNLPRRTVQTHVSRILAKLQLRSRVEIPHHVPDPAAA
ncbi:AAA family ATPase [Kitasatospora sp. RB6PN24]|uniref:ATP-binding protein n=1 Tax=Kitasatospora humi TaxID=2893891 RepID=UPI001E4335E1|nr:LuxR family transcriptional regulator [Kitasatospora humi]MCC9307379.1 AAA family ATPase [Kitasatospora humi]